MQTQLPEVSLRRWKYLAEVGLWPRMIEFNWRGWLQNFNGDEMPFAVRLLDSFLYFSQPITRQLFRSSFLSASAQIVKKQSLSSAVGEWRSFIDGLAIVRVNGERPSLAESGYAFTRLARDDLEISERQLLEPGQAIASILRGHSRDVIFVDDFVGSGSQFEHSWRRKIDVPGQSTMLSFKDVALNYGSRSRFFLCTALATEYGLKNIHGTAPDVLLLSGQILDARASATSRQSFIWRDDMEKTGPAFVREASLKAGIPLEDCDDDRWDGFHGLGLAVAFSHGWPDATLPLFSWNKNGWIPLLVKGAV
jgi:hypothetical protein